MNFCTVDQIEDQTLQGELNRRGTLLDLDENDPSATFEICRAAMSAFRQSVTALQSKLFHRDRVRRIEFGITTWRTRGAFSHIATEPNEFEFIGINHGTIADNFELFNRIFSHPDNFPGLGNSAIEVAPPPIQRDLSALADDHIAWVTPRCPIRKQYALNLTLVSLELVFLHEMAHLANGHNDFLRTISSAQITNQPYEWDAGDRTLRQTLEMDADATAAGWCLELNEMKRHNAAAFPVAYGSVAAANAFSFGTRKKYVIAILFAGYAAFRNYSKPWNTRSQLDVWHPTEAVRQKFLADGVRMNIINSQATTGYTDAQYLRDAGGTFSSVERAIWRIRGEAENLEVFNSVFETRATADYFYALERKWAEILPVLEIYKKVLHLSPVRWDRIPQQH